MIKIIEKITKSLEQILIQHHPLDYLQQVTISLNLHQLYQTFIHDLINLEDKVSQLFSSKDNHNEDKGQEELHPSQQSNQLNANHPPAEHHAVQPEHHENAPTFRVQYQESVHHVSEHHPITPALEFLTGDESGGSVDLVALLDQAPEFKPLPGSEITLQELYEIEYEKIGDHHYDEFYIPWSHESPVISVPQKLGIEFSTFGEIHPTEQVIRPESAETVAELPRPIVVDDAEQCVNESLSEGSTNFISGNVLTNDSSGDNGPLTVISFTYHANVNGIDTLVTVSVPDGDCETVATYHNATLTVCSDGTWTYVAAVDPGDNSSLDAPYNDDFTYTAKNDVGMTASATQFICVDEELAPPTTCEFTDPSLSSTPSFVMPSSTTISGPTVFTDDTNAKDGTTSLREAIITANTDKNATDLIQLKTGTYQLSIAPSKSNDVTTGDLNILKNLIIQGNGQGNTFIDAKTIDRIFTVNAGVTLTLKDLTIENGSTKNDGGAILNNGSLNLVNVTILDSTSSKGGGGAVDNLGTLTMYSSTIHDNSSFNDGGGILSSGTLKIYNSDIYNNTSTNRDGGGIAQHGTNSLTIINTSVSNNDAEHSTNGGGGGIYTDTTGAVTIQSTIIHENISERSGAGIYIANSTNALIENSLIHDNGTISGKAFLGGDKGGGIYAENTTLLIDDSTVSCNRAFDGGGLYIYEGNKESTVITITDSLISNNTADGGKGGGSGTGGGLYIDGSSVDIINSTISTNSVVGTIGRGGAIYSDHASDTEIYNSTIFNNSSTSIGVGGAIDSNNNNDSIKLTSTIVANNDYDALQDNTISDDRDLSGNGFISGGNNLIGNYTNGKSDFTPAPSDITGVDPKLGPLQDNGGPTLTHALLSGSPALDTGSNPLSLNHDQRGDPRPVGAGTDIGAYEAQSATPLILDFGGGASPIVPNKPIFFDVNNDGIKEQMQGWASPQSAFLVYDYQGGSHPITGDNISFVSYTPGATTDLQGLISFDTNHNGRLDSGDKAYSQFGVWSDKNQNGAVDKGEYLSLQKVGITGISLSSDGHVEYIGNNTVFGLSTYTTVDGKSHHFADVALSYLNHPNVSSTSSATNSANVPLSTLPPTTPHTHDVVVDHPHHHHG